MVRRFFCGGKCPTGEEVGNEAAYKCQKRGDSGRWNRARHLTTVLVEFSDGAIVEQCSPVGDGWLSCGLENTWLASICTLSNQRRSCSACRTRGMRTPTHMIVQSLMS